MILREEKFMKRRTIIAIFGLLTALFFIDVIAANAQTSTVTYDCLGVPQYFSVPPGVTQLQVEIIGADGGNAETATTTTDGGRGARIQATLNVVPGQLLTIYAGCVTGY